MPSNNETVADSIAAVRKMIHECPAIKGGIGEFEYQLKANGAIDRIESAHEREVTELRNVGNQMLRRWCNKACTCEHCEFNAEPCSRWRKVLEGADECVKNRDPQLERIIRDAVISYNEMFPTAPNDDCENELRERAKIANDWLKEHGFKEETFFFDKQKGAKND